jgi:hypothetical protein
VNDGKERCAGCRKIFDVEEARRGFNHYYADSAKWKWDDLPQRLCRDCAEEEVEARWMAGDLAAADGPPPSAERMKELSRRFGF